MSDSWICWKPRMLEPSKPMPFVPDAAVELGDGDREVLPGAGQVDELEVDDLDAVVRYEFLMFAGVGKLALL